jgi:hypothetical protein
MEGEASANNRKAKLIFFFEWTIHLKWSVMKNLNHIASTHQHNYLLISGEN